jgi:hypothetical protein
VAFHRRSPRCNLDCLDALIDLAGVVMLVGAAVVAGGQLFCLLALLPALPEFPQEMSVRVHQRAMTFRPHHYLRVAGAITIVSSAAALILILIEDDTWAARILVAAGLATTVLSGITSTREWPINDEINSWEGREPDLARYGALRRKWDDQHRVRTVLSGIALVCFAVAVVVSDQL